MAHAVTNLLLGIYIVQFGAWEFVVTVFDD